MGNSGVVPGVVFIGVGGEVGIEFVGTATEVAGGVGFGTAEIVMIVIIKKYKYRVRISIDFIKPYSLYLMIF